jgi:hypothetical protein
MEGRNGTTRWIVGLVISLVLSIGGWAFGAVELTRASRIEEVRSSAEDAYTQSVTNNAAIQVLQSQYGNIDKRLSDIYDLLTKHMGVK